MGTSEISGIGSMFTPGQPTTGSVARYEGSESGQTFQSVMSQMQTPVRRKRCWAEPDSVPA